MMSRIGPAFRLPALLRPAMRAGLLCAGTALGLMLHGAVAPAQDKVQDVTIEGRTLHLPRPPDACDLDTSERRDRLLIASLDALEPVAVQPRRVLRRFAPCRELADWRNARRSLPPDIVEIAYVTQPPRTADRAAWLRSLREQQPTASSEQLSTSWSNAPPPLIGAPSGPRRSAPIILDPDRDERALYAALYLRLPLSGQQVGFAAVAAWTTVSDLPLQFLALSAWQDDGAVLRWLNEEDRDLVDRVMAQNGEERRRFARADAAPASERREPTEPVYRDLLTRNAGMIAIGLLASGSLLIVVGLVGTRILRRRAV